MVSEENRRATGDEENVDNTLVGPTTQHDIGKAPLTRPIEDHDEPTAESKPVDLRCNASAEPTHSMMPDRHDDGADLASGEDVGVTGRDDLGKSEPNIKSESPAALPAPTVIGPSFSQERSITSRTSMAEDDIKKTTRPSSPTDIQPGPVVVVVSSDTQKIGDQPAKMPSPTADSAVQNVQGPPGSLNADEAEPPDPFDGLPDDEIAILKRQIDISGQSYGVSTFFRYATRMDILIMIVSAVCAAAVGAALPLMTIIFGGLQGVFADYLSVQTLDLGGFESAIAGYVLYFVYIAIGTFVASYISTVGFIYTGERITDKIRYEYLASCLRQNIGYFDKFGTGEFTTKITADATTVQDGISEKFGLFISAISTFVTGFAIGFIFSWKLTLILSATLFALLLNAGVATTFMVKHSVPMMSAFSESGTFVEEVFSSVRIAIAFGTQGRLTEQYDKKLEPVQKWGTKVKYSISVMTAVSMAITYWNYGLGFWQGSAFLARGDLTISKMITVMMAVMMGAFNMSAMGPYFQSFIGAVSAAKDMFRTIDRQSPLDPSADEGDKIPDLQGHIRLENIKHIYPSRPNVTVMDGVSIDVPAGKVTALVGSSGCGKSTIVGLVERFYEPVGGAVFLDDRNINTLSLRWLRQQMSLVGQEPTLFAVSIHDNIRFGLIGTDHETADEEKQRQLVEDAARQANAHEFITQLPEGYETNVGQRGFLLSGGQKQRIAIARAIVSNPKVLLLDEATSALDTKSEGVVQAALDKAAAGRTTIVIAHRLSTIRNAHNIIVMNKGTVVEQGNHDTLIQKQGAYHALVEAQQLEDQKKSTAVDTDDQVSSIEDLVVRKMSLQKETNVTAAESSEKDGVAAESSTGDVEETAGATIQSKTNYSWWELIKFVASFNRSERIYLIIAFFFCLICGAATPVQAVFFGKQVVVLSYMAIPGIDRWLYHSKSNFWSLMYLMLGGAQFISHMIQLCILGYAAEVLLRRIRRQTFSTLMRQDVSFFDDDKHNAGALTAFLAVETTQVSGFSGVALGTVVTSITNLVGSLALSLAIGWKLALVCFAAVPLAIGCGFFRWWVLARHQARIATVYADSAGFAAENISAIKTVASLTRESQVAEKYRVDLEEQQKKSIVSVAKSSVIFAAAQSIQYLCYGLGFWYGSTLIAKLEYGMFEFFVCYMSMILGATAAGTFFSLAPDLSKAKKSAAELKALIDTKPLIDTCGNQGESLSQTGGHIQFRDVYFRYPTRPEIPVLRGLNFTAEPGQHIALVGSSGCGKSTTISLIERFYDPVLGQILVDGKDISEVNINDYRSHISVVSQEPSLFQGSIRENICMGSLTEDVSKESIEIACREANIHDFVVSLPDGFDTIVGSRGGLLSTGQKQRIAIARALVRLPKILLLDEATSALDSESEHVVQVALDRAAKGRTTITVAHRLSTIQHADNILFIDQGRVLESGTHSELMTLGGRYYELVKLQSLEQTDQKDPQHGKISSSSTEGI
ncbi:unnamed protein product [Clonostachys rosea f. rosea IK726]|uniref:Uncharacterized protein n=2 Tax=Bionectria ochroleuca TaxID=29856 RepID=A0A0B7KIP8_BIOOC|nr:unnamed protein product [Clonostachys rosea f. rosea IK726]